jgi:hypothetical protein
MKKYQIQDVNLLVELYDILLPWFVGAGRATAKEKQAISAPEPTTDSEAVV